MLQKKRAVNVIVGSQYHIFSLCILNTLVPIAHKVLAANIILVPVKYNSIVIILIHNGFEVIRGCIIHNNQFKINICLLQDAIYSNL